MSRRGRSAAVLSLLVAPGYLADLVAVEGDPLKNIDAVSRACRG